MGLSDKDKGRREKCENDGEEREEERENEKREEWFC